MTFQPYSFRQLQEIVGSRLRGLDAFDPDAIQLVARWEGGGGGAGRGHQSAFWVTGNERHLAVMNDLVPVVE